MTIARKIHIFFIFEMPSLYQSSRQLDDSQISLYSLYISIFAGAQHPIAGIPSAMLLAIFSNDKKTY
jgi:hypothetical protein